MADDAVSNDFKNVIAKLSSESTIWPKAMEESTVMHLIIWLEAMRIAAHGSAKGEIEQLRDHLLVAYREGVAMLECVSGEKTDG